MNNGNSSNNPTRKHKLIFTYPYGEIVYGLQRSAFDEIYDTINEKCLVCNIPLVKKLDNIKKHFIRKHAEICDELVKKYGNNEKLSDYQRPSSSNVDNDKSNTTNNIHEKKNIKRIKIEPKSEEISSTSVYSTIVPSLFRMFKSKIAIVQAGSLLYDTQGTLEKAEKYIQEASTNGAHLILFPEAFIGGYPKALSFGVSLGKRTDQGRDEFKRYYESAIQYDGSESDKIAEMAKNYGINVVIGVVEKDGGTLYCSVFFYGPDGKKLGKHRKVMPTALERCVWGFGDGSTLPVIDTSVGKIAAAICWENYMPLLRYNYYSKGVQIYLAPTVDDRDSWISLMKTIALEGRCFVISACQYLTSTNFPEDHEAFNADEDVLIRGGSCAIDPLGKVLLEPDFNGDGLYYVEIDLNEIPRGKFDLDTVGHYSRPDIFQLIVNEKKQNVVETKK